MTHTRLGTIGQTRRLAHSRRCRGVSLVYFLCFFVVGCGFCSLAVDYGRIQLSKTELRRAADAAARAGAGGLAKSNSYAIQMAQQFASANKVDGLALKLDANNDIELVYVDPLTRKISTATSSKPANAVRVIAARDKTHGNALPLMFASLLGMKSCKVSTEAVAMYIPPVNVDQDISATSNPFLSGMPQGSVASKTNPHNKPDYAGSSSNPKQSPTSIAMPVNAGDSLSFDDIDGNARHSPSDPYTTPDGQLNDIGHNNLTTNSKNSYSSNFYNENGIADANIPINALVGVFLDDSQPNQSNAPSKNLDFSTAQSRDFSKLEPGLKQIFFIGDGLDDDGNPQEFVVPAGATRLFLATWDYYEWNNNAGKREIIVKRPGRIVMVK